jgi:hypothetical protein
MPVPLYLDVHVPRTIADQLRRRVPVERGPYSGIPRPGWALVWWKAWSSLPASERDGDLIVEKSPPASIGRADTRLLLVRLAGAR